MAAPPKAGKSTLLYHMFQSMYRGEPFLGQTTHAAPVVVFTEESTGLLTQRRDAMNLHDCPIHVVTLQPGLSWPRCIGYAKMRAQQHGAGLLVFDTISRFWNVEDEDDAAEQNQRLNPLMALVRIYNMAGLVIHHTRKSRGAEGRAVRGSNALPAASDIIVEFGRMSPWDNTSRRRIDTLSRFGETPEHVVAELDDGYHITEAGTAQEADIIRLVTDVPGITATDLVEEVGVSERQIQRLLSHMVGRGVLARTGSGASSSPFRYTLAGEDHNV